MILTTTAKNLLYVYSGEGRGIITYLIRIPGRVRLLRLVVSERGKDDPADGHLRRTGLGTSRIAFG